jgi:Helix-turn-helix domain
MHTPAAAVHGDSPTLSDPDAARYINKSPSWLRQSRMRGEGPPYIRIGRSISYLKADLDRYLDQHRCGGSAPQPQPEPTPAPATKPKRGRKPLARKGGRRRPVR